MVTGTPTMAGNKVVTYKVADEDEEEASTTFTINVSENSTPQLDDLSEGLHFYETSRMVTGTPTMAGNKVVTYKVADEDEEEATPTRRKLGCHLQRRCP